MNVGSKTIVILSSRSIASFIYCLMHLFGHHHDYVSITVSEDMLNWGCQGKAIGISVPALMMDCVICAQTNGTKRARWMDVTGLTHVEERR